MALHNNGQGAGSRITLPGNGLPEIPIAYSHPRVSQSQIPLLSSSSSYQAIIRATLILNGTSLTLIPQAFTFNHPNEQSQDNADEYSISMISSWTAIDATGTASGWCLNLRATDFDDGAGHRIPVNTFEITLENTSINIIAGNNKPSSLVSVPTSLSFTAQRIAIAPPGTGMGSYSILPIFTLTIPSDVYPGSYTSLMTATILSGP
jgi:hypothetical protein